MSDYLFHNDNVTLNLYKASVDCFTKLEVELQGVTPAIQKAQHLNKALETVQQLIARENQFCLPALFPCLVDTTKVLFSIQERLLLLKKIVTQSEYKTSNTFKLVINEPTHKKSCSNKTKDEGKASHKEAIANSLVKPRVKGLRDIAGLQDAKKILATIVILPIHQPQLYEKHKICNSMLLYGPPGTGKTLLVHALAAEVSAHLFSITSSNILSQYVGQTERMVQALFETIKEPRKGPTILFIDEIDGLCRSRDSNESEWGRRLKTELMCQLSNFEDIRNAFIICATNCPWDLDSAFLRRFQRRIYVPLPNGPDRYSLLQLLIQNTGIQISSTSWGALLNRTEGYSCSDLADVVRCAINAPIAELLDTKAWKLIGDNKYQPVVETEDFHDVAINCSFLELPPESIKARDPHTGDLMVALDIIRPTVSDSAVRQYERFMKNA